MTSRDATDEPDEPDDSDESEASGPASNTVEPPPYAPPRFNPLYAGDIPFGAPPEEPVTLVGEIPWELRDAPGEANETNETPQQDDADRDPDEFSGTLI